MSKILGGNLTRGLAVSSQSNRFKHAICFVRSE